jgi:hypothetical protein
MKERLFGEDIQKVTFVPLENAFHLRNPISLRNKWPVNKVAKRAELLSALLISKEIQRLKTRLGSSYIYFAVISLEFKEKSVALQIEDDGIGFDLAEESRSTDFSKRGAGLLGMKERAELLGGTLEIITRPGHGTRIEVEIKVNQEYDHV